MTGDFISQWRPEAGVWVLVKASKVRADADASDGNVVWLEDRFSLDTDSSPPAEVSMQPQPSR